MSNVLPRRRAGRLSMLVASCAGALLVAAPAAMASPGAFFTQSNTPGGPNVVERYDRATDGTLTPAGAFETGGEGSAALLGRQGAVELSGDGRDLYAINAGSDTVTAFRVTDDGLVARPPVDSGGSLPTSIDERANRVYVLNQGGTPNVTAFRALEDGSLKPIAGGRRDLLPGAVSAAQVSVAPDGSALVVTERLSNRIEILPLDGRGRPGAPVATPSSGPVPFGFAFDREGHLVLSVAGPSTVSSHVIEDDLTLGTITAPLAVGQGGACWVAISPNGKFAYTGNAAGGIGRFAIGPDGSLSPLGLTPMPAPYTPRDLDFARNGKFLYTVAPGTANAGGRVVGYRVGDDGSLTEITNVASQAGSTGAAAI